MKIRENLDDSCALFCYFSLKKILNILSWIVDLAAHVMPYHGMKCVDLHAICIPCASRRMEGHFYCGCRIVFCYELLLTLGAVAERCNFVLWHSMHAVYVHTVYNTEIRNHGLYSLPS